MKSRNMEKNEHGTVINVLTKQGKSFRYIMGEALVSAFE